MTAPPTTEREHRANVRRKARRAVRATQRAADAIADRDAAITAARAYGVRPVDLAAEAQVSGALITRILARPTTTTDPS